MKRHNHKTQKTSKWTGFVAGSMAAIMLCAPVAATVQAEGETAVSSSTSGVVMSSEEYASYLSLHGDVAKPIVEVKMSAEEMQLVTTHYNDLAHYAQDDEGNCALEMQEGGSVSFIVTVETAGLYQLEFRYRALDTVVRDVECGISINDAVPFSYAENMKLPKRYITGGITQDNQGNDIRPSATVSQEWITHTVADASGMYGALLFALNQGENRITLTENASSIAIAELKFYNETPAMAYDEYRQQYGTDGNEAAFGKIIEAEDVAYRSSSVISLNTDRIGPQVSPCDPLYIKVNTLGGDGWAQPGQYAAWTITVPKDGWYRIEVNYRQNLARGRMVYRRLTINGEVPFAEAEAIPFEFDGNWKSIYLGLDTPYEFYLKEGDNEICLETCLGVYKEVITKADTIARDLGTLYREIIVVTGQNPDANRDYMLADEIPDIESELQALYESLHTVESMLLDIDERSLSDDAATVRTLYVQIEGFLEDTESIPLRMSSFQTNISSFSDFVAGLKAQPLELDSFAVTSVDHESMLKAPKWTEKLVYAVQSFLGSFAKDYEVVGNVAGEGMQTVELWVNSISRDQATILKQTIDSQFTPEYNISVNLKLVQQALAPAIFSGGGPDVATYINTGDPVNLAARGGLQDISVMEGFEEFSKNFSENAFLPHEYNGGVYAVPFTEDFPVLFWRKDIFAQLGIELPTTWDEFYDVLEVIQKNNMTVGIPNVSGQMSTNNSIFAMFLYQRSGQYYTESMDATQFDSEEALAAFKQWTDLYKNYSLPVQYSFYQRFRLGDMPMGIESFTTATMLQVAAPEIDGLWEIAPLPGTVGEDGQINNTAIASGTCSVMLKSSDNKEAAWQLMKWMSSAEAQTTIGIEQEALLGPSGRFTPVTQEAFENLPWDRKQADVIRTQWNSVSFLPQIPGGYYVDRNLTNAFRRTVYYGRNYREALIEYNREINLEITRKRREFGLS